MKKVINYIKNPKKIIIYLMNKNFFFFLKDKTYLKLKFRLIMGYKLNLENPKTFNEKLQWLKLYDRKDVYTKMVDKAEVKEYVSKLIGEEYVIKTLGVYNNFKEIDFNKLPDQFVLKPTHTSGHVFICKDKTKIDYKKLEKKVNKWLKINYYKVHREWPYKNVKPRIIVEEYINELSNSDLRDYKLFVFNNKFKYSFVCSNRLNDLKFTFFDLKGKFLDFIQDECSNDSNIELPDNYQKMIELAEILSKDTIQIRVDFYSIQGKIYFGELTFYDAAGFGKFEPNEWDLKIGSWLKLPKGGA